jgi:hypothetical protein
MNLKKMLRLFHLINDYVLLKYSDIDTARNIIFLDRNRVVNLMKLNNIIGRMEIYVNEREDKENSIYMVEWFKKEMYLVDWDYDDFIKWAEEYSINQMNDNE